MGDDADSVTASAADHSLKYFVRFSTFFFFFFFFFFLSDHYPESRPLSSLLSFASSTGMALSYFLRVQTLGVLLSAFSVISESS